MNFIFAIVIYVGVLYAWGEQYLPTENAKWGVVVNETGEEIGFKTGDKILSVDNQYIEQFHRIVPTIVLDAAKTVQVERDGQKIDVEITDENLALLLKSKGIWEPRFPFKMGVEDYMKESRGKAVGIQIGDEFKGLNGEFFEYFDEWFFALKDNIGKEIIINIERNGTPKEISMTLGEDGMVGIVNSHAGIEFFERKTIKYGFIESIPAGIKRGVETTKNYLKQFKLIFNKETKGYESLGGFATIGSIFAPSWDWGHFWNMTAFISIILAIMNLLPIPALDGGHVLFLFGEMITGRKPNEKFLEYAQIAGMILLLALVLYANANDIIKMINGTF